MSEIILSEEDFKDERNALVQLRDILNSTGNLHSNWTGTPCHKNISRWAGIACNNNGRITHLVLEGINITGSITPPTLLNKLTFLNKLSFRNNSIHGPLPDLSALTELEFLFLSRNQFSGSIPISYVDIPKLKKLELEENHLQGSIPPFDQPSLVAFNVSCNQLSGSIPETSVLQRFSGSSYGNNSGLCGRPLDLDVQCPNGKGRKRVFKFWIRIGIIAGAAAVVPLFIIILFVCYYRRNENKENGRENPPGWGFTDKPEKKSSSMWSESTDEQERNIELEFFDRSRGVFDLDDLLRASAEVIGRGKLGTTYKAVALLESGDGMTVAVKRLIKDMNNDLLSKKEIFVQQMQLLGKLRHENLVEIICYYYTKDEKLIISEYLPHGNLFELLHENRGMGRQALNWKTRLSIIQDIAKGLNFLHQSLHSHKFIPHANLKSTNILILFKHHHPYHYHSCKLSDYGFLPLIDIPSRHKPSSSSSSLQKKNIINLACTRSPEFYEGNYDYKKLTDKTDIYCFGIVVLEIITGKIPAPAPVPVQHKKNRDDGGDDSNDNYDLSDWVRTVVNTDWSTDILDMEIVSEMESYDDMLKITKIALECTDTVPENRPGISEILTRIEEIVLHTKKI